MTAMTRDELITELRTRGWDRFQTTELQKYMDWALQAVSSRARLTPFMSKTSGITVPITGIVAQSTVDAVENIRTIERIYYTSATDVRYDAKLSPMDETDFFNIWYPEILRGSTQGFNSDAPTRYFLWDDNIYFLPLPTTARTCEVHYIKMPSVFGGNNPTGYPERFDKIILEQAEGLCAKRAREYELAREADFNVGRLIEEELALESAGWQEEPTRIEPYRPH